MDMISGTSASSRSPIQVWDLPVRLFHWLLAACVVTSITTAQIGGNAMVWHMRSGYVILTLVLFRVLYGIVGSSTARFGDFVRGPRAVTRFARDLLAGRTTPVLGHNPLGGWMIVAMLVVLAIQVGTGLFANDDIMTEGPLYALVSKRVSDRLTGLHETNVVILCVLIVVHLAAIVYHWRARGENLVRPMITGAKDWPVALPPPTVTFARAWVALLVLAAAAIVVWMIVT